MFLIGRLLRLLIPRCRWGDTLLYYLFFLRAHGRLPRRRFNFNDYLFHLKAGKGIDRALAGFVSDKEFVKLFVRAVVGDEYNVPTVTVMRSEEEIRRFVFPPNCVIKPTHASGEVMFADSEGAVNRDKIVSWLHLDYYRDKRERNYRNLEKKVIVEPLIFGRTDNFDYKFHCYNGKVNLVHVDTDRQTDHRRAFFDRGFQRLPFSIGYPICQKPIEPPDNLAQMIDVAEKIACYFDFIRIDMYTDNEKFVVGEITNVHGNAHERFFPPDSESTYGALFFNVST